MSETIDGEDCKRIKKKFGDKSCEELGKELDRRVNANEGRSGIKGLKERWEFEMNGNHPSEKYDTHKSTYDDIQKSVICLLDLYNKGNCGDPPSGVNEYALKPFPLPKTFNNENRMSNAQIAAGGVLGAGLIYGAYRVIRMIPSVAFPILWPTIPANVAIP